MYPDQGLYPANSGPDLCRRINGALQRADQIEHVEGRAGRHWFAPIVADAEAGFGGPLNAFEITKAFIEAGAAGVHFEDQLASEKKCGHMGGKVLVPTGQHIRTLSAARLAADVMGVPTLIMARTDAESARLITSDIDERDRPFIDGGERTREGFFRVRGGVESCIARGLSYAPYADLLWWETSKPNLDEARAFAEAIHAEFPDKMLAYNCSPSFNWEANLGQDVIDGFRTELAAMGYRFQFVTLAGFHQLNHSCSSSPAATATAACRPMWNCSGPNSRARPRLHRHPPSAGSRHRLFRCRRHRPLGRHRKHRGHGRVNGDRPVHPWRRRGGRVARVMTLILVKEDETMPMQLSTSKDRVQEKGRFQTLGAEAPVELNVEKLRRPHHRR